LDSSTNTAYTTRINRVLDYIQSNLGGDLSLPTLARVAHLSPFHFHRIFKAMVGETLGGFVRRVRLERSAQVLRASPDITISRVAMKVGFDGLPQFSRAFKEHFGLSPSAWDRQSPLEDSKIRKAPDGLRRYSVEQLEALGQSGDIKVRVLRFPKSRLVYYRVHNPYGNQALVEAYGNLIAWLGERGVSYKEVVVIGMAPDDPEITPLEKCRYDMGALVPLEGKGGILEEILRGRGLDERHRQRVRDLAAGWTPKSELAPGMSVSSLGPFTVAAVRCVGDITVADRAIQYLFGYWLPRSKYLPADAPGAEIFRKVPEEIGWETFDLEMIVPVDTMEQEERNS
jgi:AraC family transcriptional regulator